MFIRIIVLVFIQHNPTSDVQVSPGTQFIHFNLVFKFVKKEGYFQFFANHPHVTYCLTVSVLVSQPLPNNMVAQHVACLICLLLIPQYPSQIHTLRLQSVLTTCPPPPHHMQPSYCISFLFTYTYLRFMSFVIS